MALDHDAGRHQLHGHEHAHADEPEHRHPHHHDPSGTHDHAHAMGFERHAYLVSPVHDLDPRFKVVMALTLAVAAAGGPPLRAAEFLALCALLAAVAVIAKLPLGWALTRSLAVLPFALGIAAFAPLARADALEWPAIVRAYSEGHPIVWSIASKAWVSASAALLLVATTPLPRLFKALASLRVPDTLLTMLTFLYRFTDVFSRQVVSMRRAIAARAPRMRPIALATVYGGLAGNLLVRAYERGERVHAAMLSRGYTGTLPSPEPFRARSSDWVALATIVMASAASILY